MDKLRNHVSTLECSSIDMAFTTTVLLECKLGSDLIKKLVTTIVRKSRLQFETYFIAMTKTNPKLLS